MRTKLFHLGLLVGILLANSSQANAITYTFTDLGTLGGNQAHATAINNAGQVTGYLGGGKNTYAALWNGTSVTANLSMLSKGYAINDGGQMVGSRTQVSYLGPIEILRPYAIQWDGHTATDLSPPGGGYPVGTYYGEAYAVNNNGQVAGYVYTDSGYQYATLWDGASVINLGGTRSSATAINDAGQVAGSAMVAPGIYHATLWSGAIMTDLGTLGGNHSNVTAINNAGSVVGYSDTATGLSHATLWNGGTAIDLGTLGGGSSVAKDINAAGQIVGRADTIGVSHAALWNGTTAIDLNSFLDASTVSAGWVLTSATGINDHGWITGDATNILTGANRAYLLTPPVPEPEVYAMLLAGLGLVGFKSRRRRIA